jgi:hypothetical protein
MKVSIYTGYLLMSLFMMSCSSIKSQSKTEEENKISNCCINTIVDGKYNRKKVFNKFANTLNLLVPGWGIDKKGFYVSKECQLIGAFIWDITDTLNKETSLNECISLKEGHIYHFAPMRKTYSFSNIAILKDGRIKVFKAINCPEKGDKLENVIQFITDSLSTTTDKAELIIRLKNYRKYGAYLRVDAQTEFKCK